MRVSVIQSSPAYLKREKNLSDMEKFLQKASGDIVVFPELCTSGYNFKSASDLKKVSESAKKGPTQNLLRRMARAKNCVIVAGFPEVDRGRFYNSAHIITPRSESVYRKKHLFFKEKRFFQPGKQDPHVMTWKGVRFGVMICYDWFFPEVMRGLALKKVDLVAHPSNLVMPYAPLGMRVRSLENFVYSATANRVGNEFGLRFIGQSQILDTRGEILGRFEHRKAGILTRTIDPAKARDKKITRFNDIFKDRSQGLKG